MLSYFQFISTTAKYIRPLSGQPGCNRLTIIYDYTPGMCGSFQICEIKCNISIFGCKAKLLSPKKQCNRAAKPIIAEKIFPSKRWKHCHVAPEIPVIFALQVSIMLSCRRRVIRDIRAANRCSNNDVIKRDTDGGTLCHAYELVWWQNQTKDVWTFYLQPMDSFILFKLPSTFHSGASMSSLQHTSGCLQCKAVPASNSKCGFTSPVLTICLRWL